MEPNNSWHREMIYRIHASLLRKLDALLLVMHPAFLLRLLPALGLSVAVLALHLLAHVLRLLPAFLPGNHSALGLRNFLADAL